MTSWLFLAVLGVWVVPVCIGLYNLATWRRMAPHPPHALALSVLIPARNEAQNIAPAIESILRAEHCRACVKEILIYDDQSTDDTAHLVLGLSRTDPRVQLLQGRALPEGWVGKPHACQALLDAASSQHVLFLDADVRLKSDALSRLAGYVRSDGTAPILSAVPQQTVVSWFEALMLPLLHLTYLAWLPHRWANRRQSPIFTAACGQLFFATRQDLLALDGFHKVRNAVVDDLALARWARAQGLVMVFVDGFELASCRMYRSLPELWRGFSKNLYLGLGHPLAFFMALFLNAGAFVVPYVVCLWHLVSPDSFAPSWALLAWLGLLSNVIFRALLARRYQHRWYSVWLHPLAVLALLTLALNSLRWVSRGSVQWAGRSYASRLVQAPAVGRPDA